MEAEILLERPERTQVNRKVAHARKDLARATPCTIFSPEDLAIVSGEPKIRRELLDDALSLLDAEEPERLMTSSGFCGKGRRCCARPGAG